MKKYYFKTQMAFANATVCDATEIAISENEVLKLMGINRKDVFTDTEWIREDVELVLDGERIEEEQIFWCSIGDALAKHGAKTFGGEWDFFWSEGRVIAEKK